MHAHAGELAAFGIEPVAVGFSPADALAPLARHLGWPHRFLADPERVLYRRLALGRAGVGAMFSSGTRAIYADAVRKGVAVHRPVEDVRQLGGDAIAVDGRVVALWRPASPDDRAEVETIVATARRLLG